MNCAVCQSPNLSSESACRACGATLELLPATTGTSDAFSPGVFLDHGTYCIERVLGQGGFGITYRCRDMVLDRVVAIKEFFPHGCTRAGSSVQPARALSVADYAEAKASFLDEARILARCQHVGIVTVYTIFEENNTAYIVMELLQGKSLAVLLQERGGTLSESEAVRYIEQVGRALQYVHEKQLLHRDLKPEHIIVCDDGRVMLIDFGTAARYSHGKVQGHDVLVTPGYAPLEQYAQQATRGPFTDVYALSATLYCLLTGEIPAAASDRAVGVRVTPVRELNPQISLPVARAVEAGLQIEVAKRPQTVNAFLRALAGEPLPNFKVWGQNDLNALNHIAQSEPSKVRPSPVAAAAQTSPQLINAPHVPASVNISTPQPNSAPLVSTSSVPVSPASQQNGANVSTSPSYWGGILGCSAALVGAVLWIRSSHNTSYRYQYTPSVQVSPPRYFSAPPVASPLSPHFERNREELEQIRIEHDTRGTGPFEAVPQKRTLPLRNETVWDAKFSQDMRLLGVVTGGQYTGGASPKEGTTYTAWLWDIESQRKVRSFSIARRHPTTFAISDDVRWLAAYDQEQLRVWDLKGGRLRHTWESQPADNSRLPISKYPIPQLTFLNDGKLVLLRIRVGERTSPRTTVEYYLNTYNSRTGDQKQLTITHRVAVESLNSLGSPGRLTALTPDGKILLTGMESASINRLSTEGGENLKTWELTTPEEGMQGHRNPSFVNRPVIWHLRLSDDGNTFAAMFGGGTIDVFRKNIQEPLVLPSRGRGFGPVFASFSPDKQWLGVYSFPYIRIWNIKTGQIVQLLQAPSHIPEGAKHSPVMKAAGFSPDKQMMFSLDSSGRLSTWRRKNAAQLAQDQAKRYRPPVLERRAGEQTSTPPDSLLSAYDEWKHAHSYENPNRLLSFYSKEAKLSRSPNGYQDLRGRLLGSQGQNWKQINDLRTPVATQSKRGWTLYCSLQYENGWGISKAEGRRRLLWTRVGTNWRILEDDYDLGSSIGVVRRPFTGAVNSSTESTFDPH
jgi:serine/threonine protein kinase